VLVNLFSNAVKYGGGRPISARLSATTDRVKLTIADQGIGIAPEDIERIFSRFGRAAPVRHYGGLGLGLYITKHIVQSHGGEINVVSRLGHGATFAIDLPLAFLQASEEEGSKRRARA
jgi:signal transduction histidine kinase